MGSAGATLQGSFTGATGTISDRGFYYGTTASSLTSPNTNTPHIGLNSTTGTSGSFSATLSSLAENTTYYYRAYVTEYDESQGKYVDRLGETKSFYTQANGGTPTVNLQWLGGYEIPALSLKSTTSYSDSGNEKFGDSKWYNYETTNSMQKVITHTFKDGNKIRRNYTTLVDGNKQAPLWTAFVMHQVYLGSTGRTGSWTADPGIDATWQQSSAGSTGGETYNRGHFVASSYRQSDDGPNKQTFYYTNQALQVGNAFNGLIWNDLEKAVINASPSGRDTLYVVVGIRYEGTPKYLNDVQIPSHFYKLLMRCKFDTSGTMTDARGVAYYYENKSYNKKNGDTYEGTSSNSKAFVKSIDYVEQLTGYDFFANVPKNLQDAAESMTESVFFENWPTN